MRLLELRDDDFHLTGDLFDSEIPHYAILSHTWGQREHEVDFQDMVKGKGRQKPGYEKIKFCGGQAAKDGLQYFWVDSCCIDKSSSAELQEALISMFRWYQRAEKCYVYLADVSVPRQYSQWNWEQAFRGSRWFTRGWTLQELLAPRKVEFFSKQGLRLGDKKTLGTLLLDITGIDGTALQGAPMSEFTVHERFSWAKYRHTTRPEDEAYSLMGIFEVSMSVRYGEGRTSALDRLKSKVDNMSKRDSNGSPSVNLHNASSSLTAPEQNRQQGWGKKQNIKGHKRSISAVVFSPNGRMLASVSTDDSIKLWDTQSGAELLTLKNCPELIEAMAFSPDGRVLACGSLLYTIKLWNVHSGVMLQTLKGHLAPIFALSFSPNGSTLASAASDHCVKLWDIYTGEELMSLEGQGGPIYAIAFSPDGRILASGSTDHSIQLWDVQSGAKLKALRPYQRLIYSVAFSPNGKVLVIRSRDGDLKLWHFQPDAMLQIAEGYQIGAYKPSVSDTACPPDGSMLVPVTEDRSVKILDGRSASLLARIKRDDLVVATIAFSPDGSRLALGCRDGTVVLWT